MGDNIKECTLVDARTALYIAMAIFAVAFIVLVLSKLPEPILEEMKNNKDKGKEDKVSLSGVFKFRHYIGGIVAIFLYVGIEVGIPNIANLYMTNELGIPAAVAGSLVGMYWLLMLVGRLLGGALGAKISSKTMLVAVSSLAIILLIAAIMVPADVTVSVPGVSSTLSFMTVEAPVSILFFILCGLCTSVMWGGIFNLAVEGLGKYTAVASGFFMVMVCGGGILPLVQGAVADAAGYLSSYWVLVVAVGYLLFYSLIGSKVSKRADD